MEDIGNITCATFTNMSEAEQIAFVVGVANGRGLTAGMFEAYANAAQDMASSQTERDAIAASFQTIRDMIEPLLSLETSSLLNGVRAACRQPELQERFVIEALASMHVNVARALKDSRE